MIDISTEDFFSRYLFYEHSHKIVDSLSFYFVVFENTFVFSKSVQLYNIKRMNYTDFLYLGNKSQHLLRVLKFYEKELEVLKNLLEEVLVNNSNLDSKTECIYFKNEFSVEQMNIEDLKNHLTLNKYQVMANAKLQEGKIDDILIIENGEIEKEVLDFEKKVIELRQAFKNFLLKWL